MSFAQVARRLAGQAGLLLGWRPDEFWRSTPDELADAFGALCGGAVDAPLDRGALDRLRERHPDG